MLRQATLDAVKKWRYTPFHAGNASIAMTGNVVVHFQLSDKPEVHTPNEAAATGTYTTTITLTQPSSDLSTAESFARQLESKSLLKQDLLFHAELLKRLDRAEEAQRMLDEAARY
jgi:dihydroorotase-like cyclic amidohydrolase